MPLLPYPALLALHLIAVAVFLSGIGIAAGALPSLTRGDAPVDPGEVRRLRALGLYVTTPALLLVWVMGIAMALEAGWFAMGWLRIKLVLVLVLTALHGRQLKATRLLARGRPVAPVGRGVLAVEGLLALAIFALVTLKPF